MSQESNGGPPRREGGQNARGGGGGRGNEGRGGRRDDRRDSKGGPRRGKGGPHRKEGPKKAPPATYETLKELTRGPDYRIDKYVLAEKGTHKAVRTEYRLTREGLDGTRTFARLFEAQTAATEPLPEPPPPPEPEPETAEAQPEASGDIPPEAASEIQPEQLPESHEGDTSA